MSNNTNLAEANKVKNDEFYTKLNGYRERANALQGYVCRKDNLL